MGPSWVPNGTKIGVWSLLGKLLKPSWPQEALERQKISAMLGPRSHQKSILFRLYRTTYDRSIFFFGPLVEYKLNLNFRTCFKNRFEIHFDSEFIQEAIVCLMTRCWLGAWCHFGANIPVPRPVPGADFSAMTSRSWDVSFPSPT